MLLLGVLTWQFLAFAELIWDGLNRIRMRSTQPAWPSPESPNLLITVSARLLEHLLQTPKILFGIYAHGVVRSFDNMDLHAVVEESQLLEAFGAFEFRFGPRTEVLQRFSTIAVEAEMLESRYQSALIAVEGHACSREIKRASPKIGHDFYGIGIVDIGWAARSLDR